MNAALSKSVVRLNGVPGVRISPPPLRSLRLGLQQPSTNLGVSRRFRAWKGASPAVSGDSQRSIGTGARRPAQRRIPLNRADSGSTKPRTRASRPRRGLAQVGFSRPPHSTALPPLQGAIEARRHSTKPGWPRPAGRSRRSHALARFAETRDHVLVNSLRSVEKTNGLIVVERDPLLVSQHFLGARASCPAKEVAQRLPDR